MKPDRKPRLTLDQRARRRLKRLKKKRTQAMPLFEAAHIADHFEPLPTLQQVKRYLIDLETTTRTRTKARNDLMHAHAEHYSLLVQGLVSSAQLDKLCARRRRLPSSPEYAADFWRHTYERITTLP